MKKLCLYLLFALIIILTGLFCFKAYKQRRIEAYRESLKSIAQNEEFYLSEATDFEWERAVAFEFPVDKEVLDKVAGIEIKFDLDLINGIIFINNGKIVFQDINDGNPENPPHLIYELNSNHYNLYEKNTLLYADIKPGYDEPFFTIIKK